MNRPDEPAGGNKRPGTPRWTSWAVRRRRRGTCRPGPGPFILTGRLHWETSLGRPAAASGGGWRDRRRRWRATRLGRREHRVAAGTGAGHGAGGAPGGGGRDQRGLRGPPAGQPGPAGQAHLQPVPVPRPPARRYARRRDNGRGRGSARERGGAWRRGGGWRRDGGRERDGRSGP